jgi:hypothetical protein
MSNSLCGLLSATFHEAGYDHLVELIHQRDAHERRRLASLDVAVYAHDGTGLHAGSLDPRTDAVDLAGLVAAIPGAPARVFVTFDARYDERVFPYRPHHYGYLHRRGGAGASLYYAVSAALGGVPDRIGATNINNFESYLFVPAEGAEAHSVLLGNVARFAAAQIEVITYHAGARSSRAVTLPPKAHAEIGLPAEHGGARLERVEVKAAFRVASYVVSRRAESGELVLFDHLFTYAR